jgi:hypothetical protein
MLIAPSRVEIMLQRTKGRSTPTSGETAYASIGSMLVDGCGRRGLMVLVNGERHPRQKTYPLATQTP